MFYRDYLTPFRGSRFLFIPRFGLTVIIDRVYTTVRFTKCIELSELGLFLRYSIYDKHSSRMSFLLTVFSISLYYYSMLLTGWS